MRDAFAHNTYVSLAAMQGSDKAGDPANFIHPPLSKAERAYLNEQKMAKQIRVMEANMGNQNGDQ